MQYKEIMSWGGYIWIRYLLLTLAYTIFMIVKIKKNGEMPEDVEAINLGLEWRKEGFPDEK